MPYIGQDWRQPGELWIRTTEGWERHQLWRLRFLEKLNENFTARRFEMIRTNGCVDVDFETCSTQPHVFIVKNTRERAAHTSLSEAFNRLDMLGAVKDSRRFNYVARTLEILLKQKIASLSGSGQRLVFSLLQEMVQQAVKSENNVRLLQQLVSDTRNAHAQNQFHHLGSHALWQRHGRALDEMQNTLNSFTYKPRDEDGKKTMSDLPDDCIRHILKRMPNHKDIVNTGLTESRTLELAHENLLWRQLCMFHFDKAQISTFVETEDEQSTVDWKHMYKRLVKRFGMRDNFADSLHMCKNCDAIFWGSKGHPCLCADVPPHSLPIAPAACITLLEM